VFLDDNNGSVFELTQDDPANLVYLIGNGAASGRPYCYAYYASTFLLYPIPDAVYTIVPMGHIEVRARRRTEPRATSG
jgi:hypothetical protein